jgi:transporter family protein
MEFWFFLAALSVLFWGLAMTLAKISTPKLGVARVAYLISPIEGAMYFAGYISSRGTVAVSLEYGAIGLVSAFVGMIAYICFYESMVDGQVAVLGTISAAYPALTVIGALVFLSETLTTSQALGLAAVIFGVLALSYERPNPQHAIPKRSLFFALLAFLLWGFWSLTAKIAVSNIGPGNVFGCYVISSLTIPLVYVMLRRPRPLTNEKPSRTLWAAGAGGVALNVAGTLIFAFALSMGQASLVVPISSAYPLVTIAIAILLLGEKLNRLQTIALASVLIGLITIGITS